MQKRTFVTVPRFLPPEIGEPLYDQGSLHFASSISRQRETQPKRAMMFKHIMATKVGSIVDESHLMILKVRKGCCFPVAHNLDHG